ncbi:MAG: cellulase family glycosylhydrolase [Deltaproteobacteria bacterium]|nr:cellulase family glycosylhydrolase [Deltaproteobacteria bacterium]
MFTKLQWKRTSALGLLLTVACAPAGATGGPRLDLLRPNASPAASRDPDSYGWSGRSAARGGTAAERFREMDANGDGRVSRSEFRGPAERFRELDADGDGSVSADEVRAFVGGRRGESAPASSSEPAPSTPNTAPAPSTPSASSRGSVAFGLCTTAKLVDQELGAAREAGIGTIRLPVPWQAIEPSDGHFDWKQLDAVVERARGQGVQTLLQIVSISSWGTTKQSQKKGLYNSASMPKDMAKWKNFVSAVAGRYKGKQVHYEIGNEVSAPAFWQSSREDYLQFLRDSYAAIKAADPRAVVLPSAMSCGVTRNFSGPEVPQFKELHDEWLLAILSTKAFDAVNVHNYYFPSQVVANGFTFQSYMEHIRALMRQAGVSDKPIWVTETGFPARPTQAGKRTDPGSPEKQAQWLQEMAAASPGLGIERLFWILLRDREEAYFGGMGLADSHGNPRPALRTLQSLAGR